MKRIKAMNGYTIYLATARDVERYNVTADTYYIYFSSDIRDYGLAYSDPDWEADTLETALEWCNSSNYAIAKEIVEARTTAATFEEIAAVEHQLDNGMTAEEIEEAAEEESESVSVIERNGLFYVRIETEYSTCEHGCYFNRAGAEIAAANYIKNTQGEI